MMRMLAGFLAIVIAAMPAAGQTAVRFVSIDVYIDSSEPLAAWQFEFASTAGQIQVVGVENGDSKLFGAAPYYDREAVDQGRADRIVVADYSLAEKSALPNGRTRVSTLHLMVTGDESPDYEAQLIIAANHAGSPMQASVRLVASDRSE